MGVRDLPEEDRRAYHNAVQARYIAKDRNYYLRYKRSKHMSAKYGITIEQFDAMVVAQNDRCGICGTDDPSGRGTWHIDHERGTNNVRGLLCMNCNVGIGHLQHSPTILTAAITYLETARLRTPCEPTGAENT